MTMKLRLDPWAAEYNTAFFADEARYNNPEKLEPFIETETWERIAPTQTFLTWDKLLFIDGTRRIEARVLLEDEREQVAFGAMGSCAIGVVDCCPEHSRQAEIYDTHVRRICALSSGHSLPDFDVLPRGSQLGQLQYAVRPTSKRDAEAVVEELQNFMLQEERHLASRLSQQHPESLIICDGQRPIGALEENVIGYLKTIHDSRISREQLAVVRGLEQGERSPVYKVNTKEGTFYYEWFLRLRDPRPWLYSLAGMVRIQAFAEDLDYILDLANWTCLNLPIFASRQHQDPRAPQQLLPTRALEHELKRRMGDPQLIRRRITEYLSQF
jgi:uncharacterized protein